ncbi:MAG: ABC transporter ATP-binding protein [Lachnospiraceae bacterium]|nr:ABC transporter ATP-binding protein [Lachnospiraceae bacterium]
MLNTEHVGKEFHTGNGKHITVLEDVNIEIPSGKLVMLKGRSGSGKTTLLNILSTLDVPTSGKIWFNDKDYSLLNNDEKEHLRRYEMGFVFQSVALLPIMTAYENVDFALRTAGIKNNRDKLICEALENVGLADRMKHMPSQLSGGEQQRVAIARAFAHRPQIIFADEPTGSLDTAGGIRIVLLFSELIEKYGITVVMSTHDMGLVEFADILYELQ